MDHQRRIEQETAGPTSDRAPQPSTSQGPRCRSWHRWPRRGQASLVPGFMVAFLAHSNRLSRRARRARAIPTAPRETSCGREPGRRAELPLLAWCPHERARTSHALPRMTAVSRNDPPGRLSKVPARGVGAERERRAAQSVDAGSDRSLLGDGAASYRWTARARRITPSRP